MKIKKWHIISSLISPYLSASQPVNQQLIPSKVTVELMFRSDPNPSKMEFTVHIPAVERISNMPYATGKAALLALGGVCALTFVYQGIKRLEKEKKDWFGFGFISTGIAGFVALCYLASTKWFTFPV